MSGVSFTAQIRKEFSEKTAAISKGVTKAALGAWRVAVDNTPRLTGNLQNSWKLSRDRRSSYVPKAGNKPRPATPTFSFRVTKDKNVYLFNNVPYASFVEYGEGPGIRTPRLMLTKARAFFKSEIDKLK